MGDVNHPQSYFELEKRRAGGSNATSLFFTKIQVDLRNLFAFQSDFGG